MEQRAVPLVVEKKILKARLMVNSPPSGVSAVPNFRGYPYFDVCFEKLDRRRIMTLLDNISELICKTNVPEN